MNITNFSEATSLLRNAIGLAKDVTAGEPHAAKRKVIEEALKRAEQQLQLGEAAIAADLGYHLCKCDFPPSICLEEREGFHKCPKCGRETEQNVVLCSGGGE